MDKYGLRLMIETSPSPRERMKALIRLFEISPDGIAINKKWCLITRKCKEFQKLAKQGRIIIKKSGSTRSNVDLAFLKSK